MDVSVAIDYVIGVYSNRPYYEWYTLGYVRIVQWDVFIMIDTG